MRQRSVLLIAFHFPPYRGSSGLQRTLRFAQHLPKHGWRPVVLSVSPRAYESVHLGAGNEVPAGLEVHRAFGLDTSRHLSVFGRYPIALSLPDRWASWRWRAVPMALRLMAKQQIDVVWSTFPIATAHAIGLEVAQRSRRPWVAEFRDPMWQGTYPPHPATNAAWRSLERRVFQHATRVVVTTPGAATEYEQRFPDIAPAKLALITNGFDEATFQRAEASLLATSTARSVPASAAVKLLHSGVIYPDERDPTHFFAALASLKKRRLISAEMLQVVLRACGNEAAYSQDLARADIQDLVQLAPPIDYLASLDEMLKADALLVLQASNCNAQVPAKLYEYLRAGRPILALTDPIGDTARTLESANTGLIAPLDCQSKIEVAITNLLQQVRDNTWLRPDETAVQRHSRESQAEQLAQLLQQCLQAR